MLWQIHTKKLKKGLTMTVLYIFSTAEYLKAIIWKQNMGSVDKYKAYKVLVLIHIRLCKQRSKKLIIEIKLKLIYFFFVYSSFNLSENK